MQSNTQEPHNEESRHLIYFDENISFYFARAFNLFEKREKLIRVVSTSKVFGFSCPDQNFIPYIGSQGATILTKDTDFRKGELWIPLIKQYNVGVFFFQTPKKLTKWTELSILVKVWPEIRELIIKNHRPPFLFKFTDRGNLKALTL